MKDYILNIVIFGLTSFIMIIIGYFQYRKKDRPVGFWSGEIPPDDIEDVTGYNRVHGRMWIFYGLAIFASGLFGVVTDNPLILTGIIFLVMFGGIVTMIIVHYRALAKYRNKKQGE